MLGLELSLGRRPSLYDAPGNPYGDALVYEIDTTLAAGTGFAVPYNSGTYDATITWPDGHTDVLSGVLAAGELDYDPLIDQVGLVRIEGTFQRPWFVGATDSGKLKKILNFGSTGITTLSLAFYSCQNLEQVSSFSADLSSVASLGGAFQNCTALKAVSVPGLVRASCSALNATFQGCTLLERISTVGWDTSEVTIFSGMVKTCHALIDFDVSGLDTSKGANFAETFREAYLVQPRVDLWDVSAASDMTNVALLTSFETSLYDEILASWAAQSMPLIDSGSDTINFGSAKYTDAASRATLAARFLTFTDGGPA